MLCGNIAYIYTTMIITNLQQLNELILRLALCDAVNNRQVCVQLQLESVGSCRLPDDGSAELNLSPRTNAANRAFLCSTGTHRLLSAFHRVRCQKIPQQLQYIIQYLPLLQLTCKDIFTGTRMRRHPLLLTMTCLLVCS